MDSDSLRNGIVAGIGVCFCQAMQGIETDELVIAQVLMRKNLLNRANGEDSKAFDTRLTMTVQSNIEALRKALTTTKDTRKAKIINKAVLNMEIVLCCANFKHNIFSDIDPYRGVVEPTLVSIVYKRGER